MMSPVTSPAAVSAALPRVLFLMQDTGCVYGAERATLELAGGLRAAGVDARLLLIEELRLGLAQSALRLAADEAGLPLATVATRQACSVALARAIRHHVLTEAIDVLHTVGYKADLHGVWAMGGRLRPLVSTVHGWLCRPQLKERFYGWLNLQALRRFDRVIALSRYYTQFLATRGVPAERVRHIPSGLVADDVATREQALALYRPPPRPFTLGMLGRLSWEKNHDLFLRALYRLRAAAPGAWPARILIAGDGPDRACIEQRLRELGLAGSVQLAGYLPTAEFFAQTHALVICSRIENLPYSVLEAMAWARPVIATAVGGLPDLVAPDATGWLVPSEDEAGLADALQELVATAGLAETRGRAGRERLEREFPRARQVQAHLHVYRELRQDRQP